MALCWWMKHFCLLQLYPAGLHIQFLTTFIHLNRHLSCVSQTGLLISFSYSTPPLVMSETIFFPGSGIAYHLLRCSSQKPRNQPWCLPLHQHFHFWVPNLHAALLPFKFSPCGTCSSRRSPRPPPRPVSFQSCTALAEGSFWNVNAMSLQWQLQRLPILLLVKPNLSFMACKVLLSWPFPSSPLTLTFHDFFLLAALPFFCSLDRLQPAQP